MTGVDREIQLHYPIRAAGPRYTLPFSSTSQLSYLDHVEPHLTDRHAKDACWHQNIIFSPQSWIITKQIQIVIIFSKLPIYVTILILSDYKASTSQQRVITQTRILQGPSGSGRSGCYWQRGLERFSIGLLTNLPPGDVTRQAKTLSHQNRQKYKAAFSNSSYTKCIIIFTILFQPHSAEIK